MEKAIVEVTSVNSEKTEEGRRLLTEARLEQSWSEGLKKGEALHGRLIIGLVSFRGAGDPWIRDPPTVGQRYLLFANQREGIADLSAIGKVLLDEASEQDVEFVLSLKPEWSGPDRVAGLANHLNKDTESTISSMLWSYLDYAFGTWGDESLKVLSGPILKRKMGPDDLAKGSPSVSDWFYMTDGSAEFRSFGIRLAIKYLHDNRGAVDAAAFLRETAWAEKFPGHTTLGTAEWKLLETWRTTATADGIDRQVKARAAKLLDQVKHFKTGPPD